MLGKIVQGLDPFPDFIRGVVPEEREAYSGVPHNLYPLNRTQAKEPPDSWLAKTQFPMFVR